jgi:hypothetical protein
MLRELFALIEDPSHQASRLAVRAALVVALLGLVWTLLCTGLVFVCLSVYWGLLPHVGRVGALGITGGAGVVVALAVVLLYGRKSSEGAQSTEARAAGVAAVPEMVNEVIAGYPLESIAAALAAGLVASSVDLTQLMQLVGPTIKELIAEPARK